MLEEEVRVNEFKQKMQEITQQFMQGKQQKDIIFVPYFVIIQTRVRMFCLLYLNSVIIIGQFQTQKEIDAYSRLDRQNTQLLLATVATVDVLLEVMQAQIITEKMF